MTVYPTRWHSVAFSAHLIGLCQRDAGTEEIPDKESSSFHVNPPQRPKLFPQHSQNLYYHLATPFPHARVVFKFSQLIKIDFVVRMMCWVALWCLPCGVKKCPSDSLVWCEHRSWRQFITPLQSLFRLGCLPNRIICVTKEHKQNNISKVFFKWLHNNNNNNNNTINNLIYNSL